VVRLAAPKGESVELAVEVKSDAGPRNARNVIARLRESGGGRELLLLAPFLPPRSRSIAEEAGVHYADLTGNLRLSLKTPPIFLSDRGADINPLPGAGPERSLAGPRAGRVLLTLCQMVPPVGPQTLTVVAGESTVSLPYVSRIIGLLEREDLVRRLPRGPILEVDRPGVVRRWAEDYSLLSSNRGRLYLDPRGLAHTLEAIGRTGFQRSIPRYAISGPFAAHRMASAAPPSKLVCFVEDPDLAARSLDLSPTSGAGNVFLLAPYDPIVFETSREDSGKAWAHPAQVVVDCLTGPDRMPEDGEVLLAFLQRTQTHWRGLRTDSQV